MSTELWVALMGLVGSLAGTFAGILVNGRLVNYRLSRLEEKVDRQSRVVERVFRLEQQDAVTEEELRAVKHRVGTLEYRVTGAPAPHEP